MPSIITFLKRYKIQLLLWIASLVFYWLFSYDLERINYTKLLSYYIILFFAFYKLILLNKDNLKVLIWLSFGFRAVFILAIPNLSQDFYRFIWDGRMILEGFNPYLDTPESFISTNKFSIAQAQDLYQGMGKLSGGHYSNYPPLNQLCFIIANLFSGQNILYSVIGLRLIIITADFGTLYYGQKLLLKLKLPQHKIFWYILNPFIIIELTGNLHFEGVMIFFLVWSLFLLYSDKWKLASIVFACSVSIKLISLIFLPLLFQRLGWKKSIGFYSIVGFISIILFTPFYSSQFLINYTETVSLWFNNFEFNASFYYLAREIGYLFRGFNEIAIIGKYTTIIIFLFVMIIAFFRENKTLIQLITAMLIVLSFYYFSASTVHPWYIAMILFLSVFTKYKFPLVWSFVIILSYLAYLQIGKAEKSENYWIIAIEYIIVYGVFIWEIFAIKKTSKQVIKSSF